MTRQDIRRRIDGSVDIEFYRDKGLDERRAEMAAMLKRIARFALGIGSRAGTGRSVPAAAY